MDVLYERCAGLDVHKEEVVGCCRVGSGPGTRRTHERFPTTTTGLLSLLQWLMEHRVTHVVMEATGVYWKPVWHVLEGHCELVLANAHEVRNVPGRKTDMNDSTWLCDLLAHGLVRGSFVPPEPIMELRDLTRTRRQLVGERSQHVLRIQKVLEDANIKLGSFISDLMGESGRRMLEAIMQGETDPVKLAALAHPRLQANPADLVEALRGRIRKHHRFMLKLHWKTYQHLQAAVAELEAQIEEVLRPFGEAVERLMTIPGISRTAAHTFLAEVGPDMSRFASAGHLRSWAGLCPRMDESAGKRGDTRVRIGNLWLKPVLVQAAWSAARKKDSYFKAQFQRIRARQGGKKAVVAVAASLLTTAYYLLKNGEDYKDLGGNHFDQVHKKRTAKRLLKRLADLGVEVEIKNAA